MPAESIDKLLNAKGLDSWLTTVQRGIRSARRDGRSCYIGRTAMAFFIEPECHVGTQFEALASGEVFRVSA